MKIKKQFEWNGITVSVVVRDEMDHLGVIIPNERRVLAPNGGIIVGLLESDKYKDIPGKVIEFLDKQVKRHGMEVVTSLLTKELSEKEMFDYNMGRTPVENT